MRNVVVARKQKKCISVQTKKICVIRQFRPSAKLSWIVKKNPKRPGSSAFSRFNKYRRAETVAEFTKIGGTARDLSNDLMHGYVKVLGAKPNSLAASSTSSSSSDTPLREHLKVACLGDSNTQGFGLGQDSYPNRLKKFLELRAGRMHVYGVGFDVRTFAHVGAKAAPGNTQYCNQDEFQKSLEWKAQVYIIMLGTNDAHQARGQPDKVESALEDIVGKIVDKVKDAVVFLVLPPGGNSKRCCKNMSQKVHPGIKRLGKRLKLTVVDAGLDNPSLYKRYLKDDLIHLSKAGANKIGNLASKVVFNLIRVKKKS